VLALALTVVGVIAFPTPAMAASKEIVINDQPIEGNDQARAQEPLVAAATAITALDPKHEALGGIRLQVDKGLVEVYWKGDVPDAVKKEIDRQTTAGVAIDLQPAKYSGSELDAAVHEIADQRDRYPGFVVVEPKPEANGLQAYFTDPDGARKLDFPVPVDIQAAPDSTLLANRNADIPPFWGGAAARINGGGCTTGFAVSQNLFGVELSRGILSAGHCDPGGGSTWTTPPGMTIGRAGANNSISDSIYIKTSSSGRVYTGPIGSSTSKKVVAPTPIFPGQFVCTEGAATGEHCLVMNLFVGGFSFLTGSFGVALAVNITGAFAAGQGDSGGPVIVSGNPVAALAAGLISFGVGSVPCVPGTTRPLCSAMVGYIDINWALLTNFPMVLAP